MFRHLQTFSDVAEIYGWNVSETSQAVISSIPQSGGFLCGVNILFNLNSALIQLLISPPCVALFVSKLIC